MVFLVSLGLIACFAATPTVAQDDTLFGSWTYEFEEDGDLNKNLLQLSADGTFSWQLTIATNLDEFLGFDFSDTELDEEESEETAFFVQILLASLELGDGELSTILEGEWEVDGDELTLTGHISELLINDQPIDEFFVEVFAALFAGLAELENELDAADAPDGDRPTDADIEEGLAAIGTEVAAGFAEIMEEEIVQSFSFAIDGDELALFDFDAEDETFWDRVPVESAVAAQSWGQIKQLQR